MTVVNAPGPEQPINPATGKPWTLWQAVCEVMLEAKEVAGDIVGARTLMYKVRPRIQRYTALGLTGNYFTKTLLPRYQREVQVLPGVYYEPRGELVHPHDDEGIMLGTRQVEGYELPDHQFDKILFIEKTGLKTQLAPYRLAQKYDMAIIYGQGFSVVACRDLLAATESPDMPIYGVHDADWPGYNIGRTLGEPTERMPDHYLDNFIDLGLTVQQAIDEGLDTEWAVRKTALPKGLTLNDVELDWWGDSRPMPQSNGKTYYNCLRCELNAFSSDGLAAWIEAQLQAVGVTPKVVPPPRVLARHVAWARGDMLDDLVLAEIDRRIDREAIVNELLRRHPELIADVNESRVREWFAAEDENIFAPWQGAARELIQGDFDAVDELHDSVVELLVEQLEEGQ